MPESHGISKVTIITFLEHPVWDEIWKRMDGQIQSAMDKAIDESDRFQAGRYRALQDIKNLPQRLIKEIEEEPVKSGKVISIVKRWR